MGIKPVGKILAIMYMYVYIFKLWNKTLRGWYLRSNLWGTRQLVTIWFVHQFQKYSPGVCQWAQILKFFGLRQSLTHQKKNSKFKISCEKKLLLVASMGYLSIKLLTSFFFQNSKIFMSKMGRVWNQKKNQNIICPQFVESKISTTI